MSQAVRSRKLRITVGNLALCYWVLDLAVDLCGQMCCSDLAVGSQWQCSLQGGD